MTVELRLDADIRGRRLNLRWDWREPGARPAFRLLRRRRAFPAHPDDGLAVVDVPDLFVTAAEPWERIVRLRHLASGSLAEGGLLQAEAVLYFTDATDPEPTRARVAWWDASTRAMAEAVVTEVARVERSESASAPWDRVEELELFAAPGGGPEAPAGRVVVSRGHADGITPDRFEWQPAGGPAAGAVDFDVAQVLRTTGVATTPPNGGGTHFAWHTRARADSDGFRGDFENAFGAAADALEPVRDVTLEEVTDPDLGVTVRRFRIADGALPPDDYHYRLYRLDPALPAGHESPRAWRAFGTATARFGFADRLYRMLPAAVQRYDEPEAEDRTARRGQLRRFLQVFGAGLDQFRGLAESLRRRHDIQRARADLLPSLARWIGWDPDLTASLPLQRTDILFAPRIYETVGTTPNVRSLVNRITDWECRTKEFVHNVFRTNAPEEVPLWELWQVRQTGGAWSEPGLLVGSDGFVGRPVAVPADGTLWLFWHSDRSGRREIWLQRLDGVDPAPRRAMLDTPDDAAGLSYSDQDPTAVADGGRVRLFWSSDREGSVDIWTRTFDGVPGGDAERLTEHPAADRRPAAVMDAAGRTRVFWQSDRRGPTDIWARVHDGSAWGEPHRVTTATVRDEMPAALLDAADRVWLFFTAEGRGPAADAGGRDIFVRVLDGGTWSDPEPVTTGRHRDEAPFALVRDGDVHVFWHSDRDGRWDIWTRRHDGTDWTPAERLTDHPDADKDPTAVVDGGGSARVIWRSQRGAMRDRSRTIDTDDADMLATLGEFEDRAHYTYDTGTWNRDWYARDTVGIYLTTDTEDPARVARVVTRVRDFVEPFRPLPVRYVWVPESAAHDEVIEIDELLGEEWSDAVS